MRAKNRLLKGILYFFTLAAAAAALLFPVATVFAAIIAMIIGIFISIETEEAVNKYLLFKYSICKTE